MCVSSEHAGTLNTSEGFATEGGKAEKRKEGGRANEKVGHEDKKEEEMGGESCDDWGGGGKEEGLVWK